MPKTPKVPKTPQATSPAPTNATRPSRRPADDPSGRVKFDDRGNAIWEWAVTTGAFGRDVSTAQLRRLEHPGLSIAEDAEPTDRLRPNPQAATRGYDPYDSGNLQKRLRRPKKDLRKLSDWIQLRRRLGADKPRSGR